MNITKKAFIDAMTKNRTHFCGTARQLFTKDELYCKIGYCFDKSNIIEYRTCEARSNDLVFTGDVHMYFESGMEFYEYSYPKGTVYIAHKEWVTMYYFLEK